jgi:hypothetical protein
LFPLFCKLKLSVACHVVQDPANESRIISLSATHKDIICSISFTGLGVSKGTSLSKISFNSLFASRVVHTSFQNQIVSGALHSIESR